jgi:class 3 adenylate cyclase
MGRPAGLAVVGEGLTAAAVTVLFTDIVGSTQLLGVLGEEAMERCRREHFALLREALAAHSGHEVKNVGDGVMAAFGRPADGLACAIAMQIAVAGQELPDDRSLLMRVGLHHGPAIPAEGDYWGTTVVIARRLCDMAQPHEILTTERFVARSGADHGLVRKLGGMTLRGLADEVAVCAIQWHGAPDRRTDDVEPPQIELAEDLRRGGVFVGRERQLEQLEELWRAAAAGERRMALVAGPAGVGKTSLLAQLARQAHGAGALVLHGRCDEGIATPFQPIAEAVGRLVVALPSARLRAQLGGWAADLARLLPVLAELVGAVARESSDPQSDQRAMFEAVSQLLATTARSAPVLVLVEDLQWADAGTIALLRHVISAQPAAAVAVVATVREGQAPVALTREDDGWMQHVSLDGLDETEIGALLEADGGRPPAVALVRAVAAQTRGNPLHVRELTRAWLQAGVIAVRDRELTLAAGSDVALDAADVSSVIERRVEALPAATRRVLTLGAVVGRSFAQEMLERILVADEPEVIDDALAHAVHERLLVRGEDDGLHAFEHALIRQALYARIGATRRSRLHRQVAEAIEEAAAGALDEHLPELAYHFARCAADGRAAKAVQYALRAGRASLELLAHDRAALHFTAALELLDASDVPGAPTLRCDATIGLGECQARAADPAHRETLLDAAGQAERLADGERLGRAALANGRGFFSQVGVVDQERVAVLRAALSACESSDSVLRARLLAQLAMELSYEGDWEGRVALSDEAAAMARRIGDPATLVTVMYQRSVTLWGVHGLRRQCDAIAEAERQLDWLADPSLAFHISLQGLHAALTTGDLPLADRRLDAMHEHAAASGQPTFVWYERIAQGKRETCAGRLAEAQRLAFAALDAGMSAGQPDAPLWWAGQMFAVRFAQGRLGDSDYSGLSVAVKRWPGLRLLMDAQLACLQAAHGHERDARLTLDRLMHRQLADVPVDFAWIATVALAGYACWQLAAVEHAAVIVELLAPWAEEYVDMGPAWLGSASLFLGLLESTRGRPLEAHGHFARAMRMHEHCDARAMQAHTCAGWAELLVAHDLPGADVPDAAHLAREALALSSDPALPGVQQRALRVLEAAGAETV